MNDGVDEDGACADSEFKWIFLLSTLLSSSLFTILWKCKEEHKHLENYYVFFFFLVCSKSSLLSGK